MKIKALLLLTAWMVLGLFARAQAPLKVGYTTVEIVLAYMPETKDIETALKAYETKLMESISIKQRYFESMLEEYQAKVSSNGYSPEQKKAKETELQKLQGEIQAAAEEADYALMDKRAELLMPLQDKIQKAIDAVAVENGFNYILNNAAGGGIPTILYGVESMDVTEKIATKLGIKIPSGTETAPTPH